MEHKVQGVIYRQLYRKCGKENCNTCQDQGHGPYWYATGTGKALKYIGKDLPGFVEQYENKLLEQKPKMDALRADLAKQRDQANQRARECSDIIRQIDCAISGESFANDVLLKNGVNLFLV